MTSRRRSRSFARRITWASTLSQLKRRHLQSTSSYSCTSRVVMKSSQDHNSKCGYFVRPYWLIWNLRNLVPTLYIERPWTCLVVFISTWKLQYADTLWNVSLWVLFEIWNFGLTLAKTVHSLGAIRCVSTRAIISAMVHPFSEWTHRHIIVFD